MGKSCPLKRLFSSLRATPARHATSASRKTQNFLPAVFTAPAFSRCQLVSPPSFPGSPAETQAASPSAPSGKRLYQSPSSDAPHHLAVLFAVLFSHRTRAVVTATAMPSPCPGQRQRKKFLPAGQGVPWGCCPSAPGRGARPASQEERSGAKTACTQGKIGPPSLPSGSERRSLRQPPSLPGNFFPRCAADSPYSLRERQRAAVFPAPHAGPTTASGNLSVARCCRCP